MLSWVEGVGDDSGGWWIISTPIFRLSIIFVHLLLHLPLITISMGASSPDFLPFCDLRNNGSDVIFSISLCRPWLGCVIVLEVSSLEALD